MSPGNTSSDQIMQGQGADAISAISGIAYGFMGSQALFTALELGIFTALSEAPSGADALADRLHATNGPLQTLLDTCLALDLLTWDGTYYRNSPAAERFLVQNAPAYVGDYYLRQISALSYPGLPRVRAVLRDAALAEALNYAHTLADAETTEAFVRGQHAGSLSPAAKLARTFDFSAVSHLLDLGGGSGAFSIEAARRWPHLSATVVDLPQVVAVAKQIIQEVDLTERIRCASGDVIVDPWPTGADAILLSYVVSCYAPQTVSDLLARTQAYLPAGGRLLIHDFALTDDRQGPRNAALFLFGQLTASSQTHAYTAADLTSAMRHAGYVEVTVRPFVPDLTVLVSGRKP